MEMVNATTCAAGLRVGAGTRRAILERKTVRVAISNTTRLGRGGGAKRFSGPFSRIFS
jgi:hypothetical protein